jgi:hypothetical protein
MSEGIKTLDDAPEDVREWVNSLIREKDKVGDDLPHPVPPPPRSKVSIRMKNFLVVLIPYILLGVATIPVATMLYEWLFSSLSSYFWKIIFSIISTGLGAVLVILCFAVVWIFFAVAKDILKRFPIDSRNFH